MLESHVVEGDMVSFRDWRKVRVMRGSDTDEAGEVGKDHVIHNLLWDFILIAEERVEEFLAW